MLNEEVRTAYIKQQEEIDLKFESMVESNFNRSLKENLEKKDTTSYFDTVQHKKRPYKDMMTDYGKELMNEVVKAAEEKRPIDKECGKEMWRIVNKIKKKSTNNGSKRNYIHLGFETMEKVVWKKMTKYIGVYLHLRKHIVRGKMINDKFKLYNNYFKKGLLAYSTSFRHIGKECYMNRDTAKGYINKLVKSGIVKIIKIPIKIEGTNIISEQNVYILGTHNNGKEMYYIDDIE